jgi:hypothetical protein
MLRQPNVEMPSKWASCYAMLQPMVHCGKSAPKSGMTKNRRMAAMPFLSRKIINLMSKLSRRCHRMTYIAPQYHEMIRDPQQLQEERTR